MKNERRPCNDSRRPDKYRRMTRVCSETDGQGALDFEQAWNSDIYTPPNYFFPSAMTETTRSISASEIPTEQGRLRPSRWIRSATAQSVA